MSRSDAIAAHIARSIVRNTNKRFSRLHADAIEETKMSQDTTTSGMAVSSQVNVGITKTVDRKTLEGSTPGDFRAPNTGTDTTDSFKNQAGPRGETTDTPNAGA